MALQASIPGLAARPRDMRIGSPVLRLRDLPDAELHFFDTGHFALEEKADEMILVMRASSRATCPSECNQEGE